MDEEMDARGAACPCDPSGNCDCGPNCSECDCMSGMRGKYPSPTVSYSTSTTLAW